MDPHRFDSLTRALTNARSRRGTLLSLLGGALGLLGLAETAAKKGKDVRGEGKNKKKKKKKKKRPSPASLTPVSLPPPPADPGTVPSPPPPPPLPPPVCTPTSCTGKRTCQNGICACPSGTKFCEFEGECEGCCSNAECCNGAVPCPPESQTCVDDGIKAVCGCRPGTEELCGGKCLAPCGQFQLRNPVTCGCCWRNGAGALSACTSPPCCGRCVAGDIPPFYACVGRNTDETCDFGGQCVSGICTDRKCT